MTHQPHPCDDATVKPVAGTTCLWSLNTEDDTGMYETSCRNAFLFTDGGPKENEFKHCCYCGKPLSVNHYTDADRDGVTEVLAAAPVEPVAVVAATDLHQRILNLPSVPTDEHSWRQYGDVKDWLRQAYSCGHRDARHAAAELAAAIPAPDVLSLLQRARLYTNTVSVQHERGPFAVFRSELEAAIAALEKQ